MWPIWDELKKRRAFREVWIGYLLGGAFFPTGALSNQWERQMVFNPAGHLYLR